MADRTSVLIVGAGPAGLVLGNLLRAAGIDTLVLERGGRDQVQARARAGFLGANSARVLTEHGLGSGMLRDGSTHGTCAFRDEGGEFELRYDRLGRGEQHTVYPQHRLVTDLVEEYLARGGELRFGVTVTDVDAETATVGFRDEHGKTGQVNARFLAGCDGSNGATRKAVPAPAHCARDHGISWLAVLAEAPQSMPAVTYALHERGFAGHMARSPTVTRYYLQVPPGDDAAAWTDERIWAELAVRMRTGEFGALRQGPVTERRIVRLRSDVVDPLRHGRLFLAGDAASLISPSAAKGANLAIMAAEVLAAALTDALLRDDEQALAAYSRTCLPRIWRAQEFSHWMIGLLHDRTGAGSFGSALRRTRLDNLRDSRAHQDFFAENYVGI
ncbi:4-hydroxybenzoate 3-monooxygenase [Amycolatopsis sp. WQ 127309]|uniref:4-hydroxybenzoate 3-monooxygenase n=1 Tax=Amycolatopsis sp. WQ 127309 TaxID=2932773 RepID=UPI001FF675F0|nr:4-hydroxybenzoate 3-monooxygenase [Amycolatopsis sp. WQ 127309]UOZ03046.1 4-hydroxybenzoate 3-monooxygenase [Amycolatopsis sp. WQ 127309]